MFGLFQRCTLIKVVCCTHERSVVKKKLLYKELITDVNGMTIIKPVKAMSRKIRKYDR
jgi:hypothetical protein